jgi:Transcription factor WhiB
VLQVDAPVWTDAQCHDPSVRDDFFPEKGTAQRQAVLAKKVCNGTTDGTLGICPRRQVCLDYALTTHQRFGVWGGMSERERAKESKRRKADAVRLQQEKEARRARRAAASRKGWETRRGTSAAGTTKRRTKAA